MTVASCLASAGEDISVSLLQKANGARVLARASQAAQQPVPARARQLEAGAGSSAATSLARLGERSPIREEPVDSSILKNATEPLAGGDEPLAALPAGPPEGKPSESDEGLADFGASPPRLPGQSASLTQVCTMCLVLYGSLALAWGVYWHSKAGRAAPSRNLQQAQEGGQDRARVSLLCITWAATSVGMHVLNKSLVTTLEAPALISTVQMSIAVVTTSVLCGGQLRVAPRDQLLWWLSVPLFFAGMLVTCFYAFEYITLTLFTVVRNLAPLVVLPVEYAVMPREARPVLTSPTIAAILIMLVGATVYCEGNLASISVIGVVFALLNVIMAVLDRVLQRRLLTQECKDLPSGLCTIVNNLVGVIPTFALACATGQLKDAGVPAHRAVWLDSRMMLLLLISGLVGTAICYLGFEVQRAISATSFLVMSNLSKVAIVLAGGVFFGDSLGTPLSVMGIVLSLGGSFLYGNEQLKVERVKAAQGPLDKPLGDAILYKDG